MGFRGLKFLGVAAVTAMLAALPCGAQPSPTTIPTTFFNGDVEVAPTQNSVGGNFWVLGTLGMQAATNTSNYAILAPFATLGQTTTYTLPDPGATTDTIATAGGSTVFTTSPTFPTTGIILKGTSHNATVKALAGLGQATTYTIPDPGASTDTFATLKVANVFTANQTAPAFVLTGTSFNGTFSVISTLGQASAYTFPDPGVASANVLLDQGVTSAITIQHVSVNLSSAQLLGMSATPVVLIPAGAAGTNIVVHHALFTMNRTATAYTSGGTVVIQSSNTATGAGTQVTGTIASTVLTTAGAATTYNVVIPVAFASAAATGIYISNQTGAFLTGTGTAVVDLWFSIK